MEDSRDEDIELSDRASGQTGHSARVPGFRGFVERVANSGFVSSFRAQMAPAYLDLNLAMLFWIFLVASILGLGLEDLFHVVVYGGYESRAGLVWGPFSPIYGVGAVALTLFLNRFYYTHDLVIFLIAMVVGATLEYSASWMMETFWHAVAWDYTGTFGSINGRTNFFFGVMWGTLGLFWVRLILPVIKAVQRKFSIRFQGCFFKVLNVALAVFMVLNAVVTVLALHREGERTQGIPPRTQIDVLLDQTFTDEWLQQRFHNMTVSAEVGAKSGQGDSGALSAPEPAGDFSEIADSLAEGVGADGPEGQ